MSRPESRPASSAATISPVRAPIIMPQWPWPKAKIALEKRGERPITGLRTEGHSRWMGFRPSMPDSLPVIGRTPAFSNAILAFGHGHCGMMMGARTGRIVADLLAGRDPELDMRPYSADRF